MPKTIKRTPIAEFILRDEESGTEQRIQPFSDQVELTPLQFNRFVKAGCIHEDDAGEAEAAAKAARIRKAEQQAAEQAAKAAAARAPQDGDAARIRLPGSKNDPASIARQQINTDKLFDSTVGDLKGIAATENIDLGQARTKADIVAVIRAHRSAAAQAGNPAEPEGQRTEEGEAARREDDRRAAEAAGTTDAERQADQARG
jgi:hypothetical protein